ncbi:MAG: nucleotidyltransferase [bacterium]
MVRVFEAAWEFHLFFTAYKIPYVIIGGIAAQHWGHPRLTRDVDMTIIIPLDQTDYYIDLLISAFQSRVHDVKQKARDNRILLLSASNGCDIDVSLGIPGYEDEVLRRSVFIELDDGKKVRVCSPEDLIIHKAVAGRGQDILDIDGVISRMGSKLDVEYIREWLKQFSFILETDDVINRFEEPFSDWEKYQKRENKIPDQ